MKMMEYLKLISKKYWVLLTVVALVQTLALVWMVGARVSLLSSGREVVLETVPVDPRSIFRGDYVRLAYKISRLEGKDLPPELVLNRNDVIYLTLLAQHGKPAKLVTVTKHRFSPPAVKWCSKPCRWIRAVFSGAIMCASVSKYRP